MTVIELVTHVHAPRTRCFDLARSVDAHLRSARGTSESAIAGRTSGLLGLNDEVTWQARHFGVRLRLQSRITSYRRPDYFQDQMVRGPLKRLVHDHYFDEVGDGTTAMRDVFAFQAPIPVLGWLVEVVLLRRHFSRFLEARNGELKRLAESPSEWRLFVTAENGQGGVTDTGPGRPAHRRGSDPAPGKST